MKKIIITFLLLTSLPSFAQMVPMWTSQFGLPQYSGAYPFGMVADDSNNVYGICEVVNYGMNLTTNIDPVIYKKNPTGETIWYKNLGLVLSQQEHPFSLAIDKENNLYFLCSIIEAAPTITIVKLTTNGIVLWEKKLSYLGMYERFKVELNSTGCVYVSSKGRPEMAYANKLTKINSQGQVIDSIEITFNNLPLSIVDFHIASNDNIYFFSKTEIDGVKKNYISLSDTSHNIIWTRELNYNGFPCSLQSSDSAIYLGFDRYEALYGYIFSIYKYDINGNLKWYKEEIDPVSISNDIEYTKIYPKILISKDKNPIIINSAKKSLFSDSSTVIAKKLNSHNGNPIWSFKLSDFFTQISLFTNAIKDSSENLYLCCNTFFSYGTGNSYSIIKLSSQGELLRLTKNEKLLNYRFDPQFILFDKQNNLILNGAYWVNNYSHEMSNTIKYSQPVNITASSNTLPNNISLHQNYPNPFNPNTVIRFQLPVNSFVNIKVYDINGREVSELVNEKLNAGEYKINFNGASLPSGVYYYKMSTDNFSVTKKMILVK